MDRNWKQATRAASLPPTVWAIGVAVAVLMTGCSSSNGSETAGSTPGIEDASSTSSADGAQSASAESTPQMTRRLDSIAVLGHSGATGTLSDRQNITRDAHENSWATGENPRVRSIYWRLLQDHPAMEGHNFNAAVNGSTVNDLESQFEALLTEADPLPDVVLIQTIDNDMRCDGTDADNYAPFARTLDDALATIEEKIPNVQFYLVSQWATVENWTAWAANDVEKVQQNSGNGPCDVFKENGQPSARGCARCRPSSIPTGPGWSRCALGTMAASPTTECRSDSCPPTGTSPGIGTTSR
jgi:hypothetical protein